MITFPAILMYLCIPLFGDGLYFLLYGNDGPACGFVSLIFFNLAFLSLFLPYGATDVKDSVYLKKGLSTVTGLYLVLESIIAFLFISCDGSERAALAIQSLTLGLFLITFFRIVHTNKITDRSIKAFEGSVSQNLRQARDILQMSLTLQQDQVIRENLRELLSDINSMPFIMSQVTESLDSMILEKCVSLSHQPTLENISDVKKMLSQRKTMTLLKMA